MGPPARRWSCSCGYYFSAQLFFWGAEVSKVYTTTVGFQRERQRDAMLPRSSPSILDFRLFQSKPSLNYN